MFLFFSTAHGLPKAMLFRMRLFSLSLSLPTSLPAVLRLRFVVHPSTSRHLRAFLSPIFRSYPPFEFLSVCHFYLPIPHFFNFTLFLLSLIIVITTSQEPCEWSRLFVCSCCHRQSSPSSLELLTDGPWATLPQIKVGKSTEKSHF